MVLQGKGRWCYRGRVGGAAGEGMLVLQGKGRWCYRGRIGGATGEG